MSKRGGPVERQIGRNELTVERTGTEERSEVSGAFPILRWEFMSIIVWDDDSRSSVSSDLEDAEVLNSLGAQGWDLVCVVPLARTQVLEMAYPGNTRKLLAYLKRPIY